MSKKLIITNILSVTIAVTGTLFAIGCADNDKSNKLDPVTALNDSTWLENTQTLAESLLAQGMLVSSADEGNSSLSLSADINSKNDATFHIDEGNSYDFTGSRHTLSVTDNEAAQIQDLDSEEFKHQILWINQTADGFEGQVRLVKPSTVQQIKDEDANNEFEYDYKVRGFFRYVSQNNASYSIDDQSGQASVSALAVYQNVTSDQVTLEGSFDGSVQLTHDEKTASLNLDGTNSNNLREWLTSHLTSTESAPANDPTANPVQDLQSIEPLHLAFDINFMINDADEVTKRLEITHARIDSNDDVTQGINFNNPIIIPPTKIVE